MNITHEIKKIENEEVLILKIQYNEEFALDFFSRKKLRNLYQQITSYLKNAAVNFHGQKVLLVINGILVSTLLFTPVLPTASTTKPSEPIQYVQKLELSMPETTEQEEMTNEENSIEQEEIVQVENESETAPHNNNSNSNKNNNSNSNNNSNNNSTTKPTPPTTPPSSNVTNPVKPPSNNSNNNDPNINTQETIISLRRSSGIVQIALEDYIIGVVGAEMLASFQIEALKSQAVAARTYALKKINAGVTLSDTDSHQRYKDNNELKQVWGKDFDTYYNKIKSAVQATKGQVITYQGNYIDAVYHSTSNGKTEDAKAVWGNSVPYLVSVDSPWDKDASSYLRTVSISEATILSTFGVIGNIEVISYTNSNRIASLKIGEKTISGVQFRNSLGLRSTDFDISYENGSYIITTRGYGHGVGMSQYGANGMAKEGYSYRQILSHYYQGTTLTTK